MGDVYIDSEALALQYGHADCLACKPVAMFHLMSQAPQWVPMLEGLNDGVLGEHTEATTQQTTENKITFTNHSDNNGFRA